MIFLGIETSCDETSIAVLKTDLKKESFFKLSPLKRLKNLDLIANSIQSQIKIQKKFQGVVPEIGARQHAQNIHQVFKQALIESQLDLDSFFKELSGIYVTTYPGLLSALLVGLEFAKSLKFYAELRANSSVSLRPLNHLKGHLASSFFSVKKQEIPDDSEVFGHLHLLVSGGNTQIIYQKSHHDFQIIGQTLDDAAGECLDKIGRMLGLEYPGGVHLAAIAGMHSHNFLNLPKSLLKDNSFNFSFSGLKTAVKYRILSQSFNDWKFQQSLKPKELELLLQASKDTENYKKLVLSSPHLNFIYQMAVSAQTVVIEQLVRKLKLAITAYQPRSIGISGGVSANLLLRKQVANLAEKTFLPPKNLTGDNGAMIALAGVMEDFSE